MMQQIFGFFFFYDVHSTALSKYLKSISKPSLISL